MGGWGSWEVLPTGSLPQGMECARIANLDNRILLFGECMECEKYSKSINVLWQGGMNGGTTYDHILELDMADYDNYQWKNIGVMSEARYAHAVSVVDLHQVCPNNQ